MKNLLIALILSCFSLNIFASGQLNLTSQQGNNYSTFSTSTLPAGKTVTIHCSLKNKTDATGYIIVTPYTGFFTDVNYNTCKNAKCSLAKGPIVYLDLINTIVNIEGVKKENEAIVIANQSTQSLSSISCYY